MEVTERSAFDVPSAEAEERAVIAKRAPKYDARDEVLVSVTKRIEHMSRDTAENESIISER